MEKKYSAVITAIVLIALIISGLIHFSPSDNEDHQVESDSAIAISSTDDSHPKESAYTFRNETLLNQHYEKHGIEMGFSNAIEYETAANKVISNPNSLHKKESEDNDDVYYLEATNEFVIVSVDGYIRTYFKPDRGIDYYNKQ